MTNSHGTIRQEYPEPLQIIVEHCSCQEEVESELKHEIEFLSPLDEQTGHNKGKVKCHTS